MKTEDVKALPPSERFFYWIRERHCVYRQRLNGVPKPWTDDVVLQSFFFTNPYREHDKVTVWFKENIREPLRDDPRVIFATIAFRWFNLPATAEVLGLREEGDWPATSLLVNWDAKEALSRLDYRRRQGEQLFTGAYMINSPGGEPKLEAIIRRVTNVWEKRDALTGWCFARRPQDRTLEAFHSCLTQFDGMGGFMAYEVVCDLRYTSVLEHAPDKLTWCNPGPGCIRGLYRIHSLPFPKGDNASAPPRPKGWTKMMDDLLDTVRWKYPGMPRFEMREIEHSLCEWDKYERALWQDGRLKRKYNGQGG